MMFLARRAVAAHPLRRTLFATAQFNFPATARDNTENKPTAKRGRGRPPKNPGAPKETPPTQQKHKLYIPKGLKPPKAAPAPFFLFYSSFSKSQPKENSLQGAQGLVKRAAEIWRGYSMAEKQPFFDEFEARKTQAKQQREDFIRNTSLTDLRRINASRKSQGKRKYHFKGLTDSSPASPYTFFVKEFCNSPDGRAIINETSPEENHGVRAFKAAANRWKSMSLAERAPYGEIFNKAREAWKAEHADS